MRTALFASFRRRLGAAVAGGGIVLFAFVGAAPAAKQVALVIGNGAYEHVSHLPNPPNDAEDVRSALARLGFAVTYLDNASLEKMSKGLKEFEGAAARSEIAVVFYAGHGIEMDDRNYLIPVDAKLESDLAVKHEAMPLDLVLESVQDASRFRLVILDACRNNPFVKSMKRRNPTRQINRGLRKVEPSGDMLLVYAAMHGATAADGEGRNSPYTQALLRYLEEPGLDVGKMFRQVRDAVKESTGGSQVPYMYGSLPGASVYLCRDCIDVLQAAPSKGKGSVPGQGSTPNPVETARPAERIVLPDGLTLADWAHLAEHLLKAGEYARVQAEASKHIEKYGRVGSVVTIQERAVAGLMKEIRFETKDEAAPALERIEGIEAAGRTPDLLRLKARAYRLLGDYAAEVETHRGWLRAAPQTHAERKEVVDDLARARYMIAQGKRFSELLGRPFSEKWKEESVGWTDMHYAAFLNLPGVVTALADAGMDVDVRLKINPLLFYTYSDLNQTLDSLGGYYIKRSSGETPLMIAAMVDARRAAAELLAQGADVKAATDNPEEDSDGETPLHLAVSGNFVEMVEVLLAAGADVNAEMRYGGSHFMMPMDIALSLATGISNYPSFEKQDTVRMQNLLRRHGGKCTDSC